MIIMIVKSNSNNHLRYLVHSHSLQASDCTGHSRFSTQSDFEFLLIYHPRTNSIISGFIHQYYAAGDSVFAIRVVE